MTLKDLIKREGGVLGAERWLIRKGLTISATDLYRWTGGKNKPSPMSVRCLAGVGVEP